MNDFKSLLKNSIIERKGILFTGSGFSIGMTNVSGHSPQDAESIAKEICKLGKFDENKDLMYASDRFITENPLELSKLVEFLEKEFTIVGVRNEHEIICSKNWLRFYTTNYDNGIEFACSRSSKFVKTVDLKLSTNEYINKNNICLHINGAISNLTAESLTDEIKLSSSSYLSINTFKSSDWYKVFKNDLEKSSIIVFVGYSLYDFDVEQLLFQNRAFKGKTFFIVGKKFKDIALEHKLSKYGTVIKENYDYLAEALREIELIETDVIPYVYSNFSFYEKYEIEDNHISDEEIRNFLIFGKYNKTFFQRSLNIINEENLPFSITYRTQIENAVDSIKGYKDILILSELGNGKTIFFEILATELLNIGIKVYKYENREDNPKPDIDNIMLKNEDAVIFIDGYLNHDECLEHINIVRNNKVRLVVSTRLAQYNKNIDKAYDNLKDPLKLNIDILENSELESFVKIFDNLGNIWGKDVAKSFYWKLKYLKEVNKAQISLILLTLLNSKDIIDRVKPIVSNLIKGDLRNVTFAISYLSTLDIKPNFFIVSEIAQDEKVYSKDIDLSNDLSTIFYKNNNMFEGKSSLFSTWLIKNNFSPKYIIDHCCQERRKTLGRFHQAA